MLICDRIGAQVKHEPSGSSTTVSALSMPGSSRMIRIFCYGDSLTSGTSPPEFREYPYAPHLERALRSSLMTTTSATTHHQQQQQQEPPDVMVRHFGLPGWTTAQMIQELHGARGLATLLEQQAPIHIVIILAGTNDLGYSLSNDDIIRNLMAMHDICWNDPMQQIQRHVIAIGIPPSAFQAQYSDVGDRVVALNQELAQWCARQPERITYVPFPIPFWDRNDDRWSQDGLHFSPKGYQALGESLAPIVRDVLIKFVPEM
jgi:lysophospholipase L1-like esterase